MAKPTPRPWRFDGRFIQAEARIVCEMGMPGVRLTQVDQANAILVVEAVNAPDVAALAASHAELKAENAALVTELRHQWEYNHAEHCTNMLTTHPEGERCHWPMPEILRAAPARRAKRRKDE